MGNEFTTQNLMESAAQSTDLTDFGEITFRDGLDALVDAINTKSDLHEQTRHYLRAKIVQILENRLQVTHLVQHHPEILDEKISEPVIITGLPRSGTTILQTLIALDPACRFLRNWESAMNICPPPQLLHSATDPRIQAFHNTVDGLLQTMPALRAINGLNFIAGGTAECQNLMAHAFRSFEFCAGFGLQSYGEWLLTCDMRPGYQYHKLLLKVLQWKSPNERWVLKAPMHLIALETLLDEYPDARIVFTHRDPFMAMLSGSSLVYNWSTLASQHPDKKAIGHWFPGLWEKAMQNALTARDRWGQDRIIDIYFDKLNADPVGTVTSIYEHFGLTVSQGHLKRMQSWLRDNPRSSFGNHSYAADDFGLIPEKEERRFSFYKERFGI
jgi:Sulfotransferase family